MENNSNSWHFGIWDFLVYAVTVYSIVSVTKTILKRKGEK